MKKIVVAGPIPTDYITTHQGHRLIRHGCITHPSIALAKLLDPQGKIIPVTHVRKKDKPDILEIFNPYKNISTQFVNDVYDTNDVIELTAIDTRDRTERQTDFMHPLMPEHFESLLDSDYFLIVPVTDFEFNLATLEYLRKHSNGCIIFDAHGVTSTVQVDGTRIRKAWVDMEVWLKHIDILKMNSEEALLSLYPKAGHWTLRTETDILSDAELTEFADYCLNQGVKAVYITANSKGCHVFSGNKKVEQHTLVPALKMEHIVDTTGCGDSFCGGLCYGHLLTNDYVKACYYANVIGALRTQGNTFDVFLSAKETQALVEKWYGKQ